MSLDFFWRKDTFSPLPLSSPYHYHLIIFHPYVALQAATILVAMASEKNIWRLKFGRKSPVGDQQIIKEIYLYLLVDVWSNSQK